MMEVFKIVMLTLFINMKIFSAADDCEIHIVFLIDLSPSLINSNKKQIVKFVNDYITKIEINHKITKNIIIFSWDFQEVTLDELLKKYNELAEKISRRHTIISGALNAAFKKLEKHTQNNIILILSDFLFNDAMSKELYKETIIKSHSIAKKRNIIIQTVGFNYNYVKLFKHTANIGKSLSN